MSNKYALQSAIALYDSLNDDDDEIRDLSAKSTSSLLKKSLLPLSARAELAELINQLHNKHPLYISEILCRVTGTDALHASKSETMFASLEPAEAQLLKALKEDDSLFVEEKQNLFIDEVRETQLWCEIFEKVCIEDRNAKSVDNLWTGLPIDFIGWVLDGLKALNKLLETEDGALGWTSKPPVFAICMRIILCANAVLAHQDILAQAVSKNTDREFHIFEETVAELKQFVTLGREKKMHGSILHAII